MFRKIERTTILNVLRCGLFLVVLYLIQGVIMPWFSFGWTPLLFVPAAVGIGLFTDSGTGAFFGLFAGIFCDFALSRPTIVFTLALTLAGLLTGYLGDTVISKRFVPYVSLCLVFHLAAWFIQVFPLLFFRGASLRDMLPSAILQLVASLVCSAVMYPILKRLARKMSKT